MLHGDFRVVLEKPNQAEGQVPDSRADLVPGRFVAFDVAAILLGKRETERARIHVDVGFLVRDIGDRKGANQRVEMQRVIAAAGFKNLGPRETPGFQIVEVAEINSAVITRWRLGELVAVLRIFGQAEPIGERRQVLAGFAGRARQKLLFLVIEIDYARMRFIEIVTRLTAESVCGSSCGVKVAFLGGIDKDLALDPPR